MKKFIIFTTLLFVAGSVTKEASAQITKGGSKKNWEKYSVIYDTVITKEIVTSAYPSTSGEYFSFGIVSGRGTMADPQTIYFPENGFKGTGGHDFSRLFELSLGSYKNFDKINKNLHPAIDISGNFNLATQFGRPSFEENPDPSYTIDYGLYFGVGAGYGAVGTFKPYYIIPDGPEALKDLWIDVGYRLDAVLYVYGETTYSAEQVPNYPVFGSGTIDPLAGLRIDGSFIIGARYKFLGFRMEFANDVANVVSPEINHYGSWTNQFGDLVNFNDFEEHAVDYQMTKFVFSVYF